jgi:hypothetical protein
MWNITKLFLENANLMKFLQWTIFRVSTKVPKFPDVLYIVYDIHLKYTQLQLLNRRIISSSISLAPTLEHTASVKRFVSLQFLNLRESVGLFGQGVSPSQGRYIIHTQNKHKETSVHWVGLEPTIAVLKREEHFISHSAAPRWSAMWYQM